MYYVVLYILNTHLLIGGKGGGKEKDVENRRQFIVCVFARIIDLLCPNIGSFYNKRTADFT